MLRPWGWYLQIVGTNQMNDAEKRNVLRHDANASQLLKNEVKCKACNNLLKVRISMHREETRTTTLAGWITHKLCCDPLQ